MSSDRIADVLRSYPLESRGLPPGASASAIALAEARVGRPFPAELVQWLTHANGAHFEFCWFFGVELEPSDSGITKTLEYFPEWRPLGWIPIGSDGCGSHYVLAQFEDLSAVLFIDHEVARDRPTYAVASSFGRFLNFVLAAGRGEERWPFDRDYVLSVDPEFGRLPESLLPWK